VAQQGLTELKDLIWKHLNHDWIFISSWRWFVNAHQCL
jgi:hypothetical protein